MASGEEREVMIEEAYCVHCSEPILLCKCQAESMFETDKLYPFRMILEPHENQSRLPQTFWDGFVLAVLIEAAVLLIAAKMMGLI
jgi:hypothetical protein